MPPHGGREFESEILSGTLKCVVKAFCWSVRARHPQIESCVVSALRLFNNIRAPNAVWSVIFFSLQAFPQDCLVGKFSEAFFMGRIVHSQGNMGIHLLYWGKSSPWYRVVKLLLSDKFWSECVLNSLKQFEKSC